MCARICYKPGIWVPRKNITDTYTHAYSYIYIYKRKNKKPPPKNTIQLIGIQALGFRDQTWVTKPNLGSETRLVTSRDLRNPKEVWVPNDCFQRRGNFLVWVPWVRAGERMGRKREEERESEKLKKKKSQMEEVCSVLLLLFFFQGLD